jgi:Ser/Thr protein kinase RdoA (MazF antagonist)
MCHGDLNTSNLHFDGETATVLDFDCAAWGWRANDISGFARGVTLFRYPGDEATNLISSFLRGYQDVRCIPEADYEALPAFLLAQRIWLTAVHLEGRHRWGLSSFGPAYLKRFYEWLTAWSPILDNRPGWLAARI